MEFPIVPTIAGGVAGLLLIVLTVLFCCMWNRKKLLKRKKRDFRTYVERLFNDSVKDKSELSLNEAYRKVSYPDFPDTTDFAHIVNRSETATYDEVPYDVTQDAVSNDSSSKSEFSREDTNTTNIISEKDETSKPKEPANASSIRKPQDQPYTERTMSPEQPEVIRGQMLVDRGKLSSQMSDEVPILPPNEKDEETLENNNNEDLEIDSIKASGINISFEHGDEGITRL